MQQPNEHPGFVQNLAKAVPKPAKVMTLKHERRDAKNRIESFGTEELANHVKERFVMARPATDAPMMKPPKPLVDFGNAPPVEQNSLIGANRGDAPCLKNPRNARSPLVRQERRQPVSNMNIVGESRKFGELARPKFDGQPLQN